MKIGTKNYMHKSCICTRAARQFTREVCFYLSTKRAKKNFAPRPGQILPNFLVPNTQLSKKKERGGVQNKFGTTFLPFSKNIKKFRPPPPLSIFQPP